MSLSKLMRERREVYAFAVCVCLFSFVAAAEPDALASDAADAGAPHEAADTVTAVEPETASPEPAPEPPTAPTPDEEGLEQLLQQPVLSAASKTAQGASEAPATTWSISGTDLKRYGIQSVEEAIRFLGHGMTSYEYDGRLDAAFAARGYLSDNLGLHLAVLIDGNQAGGSAKTARGTQHYMMPIELVDHIEVVLGPGSVIYGNSAMLGVVNVVTRSASSMERPEVVVQGSAGTPADKWAKNLSWGEVWGRAAAYGGQSFSLAGDPLQLSWHLAFRWDRQQGRSVWRPNGSGADEFTDALAAYSREDAFNRDTHARLFARAVWGKWRVMASVALMQGNGTGPISSGNAQSSYVEPEYNLDIAWSTPVASRGDFSIRAYAVVFDSRATLPRDVPDPADCLAKVGTSDCYDTLHYLNFRPYLEPLFSWDWLQDGSHVTSVGGQAFIDGSVITSGVAAYQGGAFVEDAPIVAPLPTGALYLQHLWRGGFGSLNAGVRGDVGILGWAVSPRLAYAKNVWANGTIKAAVSTGFRTPTITERYLEIPHFLTANADIRPERVYSGEVSVLQQLGPSSLQVTAFGTYWEGIISTRNITVEGESVSQFANLRTVWSAGVNAAWQGVKGPVDWALSVNYAPGRLQLPPNLAQASDEQLAQARVDRTVASRYGVSAFNSTFLPVGGMPDFYATGHVSYSFGDMLPRLSVAANLNSPRLRTGYTSDSAMTDPRNADGPQVPWSIDVRGAIEQRLGERVGVRLIGTFRSLPTVASGPRVGDTTGPVPYARPVGVTSNPQAPVAVMAEVSVRL